jgi:hypothetical protein
MALFCFTCRAAILFLLMGFDFSPQRLSSGPGLLVGLTGHSGGRSIEVFSAMHTTECSNDLALDAYTCVCFQPSSRLMLSAWVAMLKCGRFLANGQHCAISYWSDSFAQCYAGWLVGSFVGPDLTLRGGEGMHLVVCEGRIQCQT